MSENKSQTREIKESGKGCNAYLFLIYSRVLEVRIQQLEEESGSSCSEEEEEDGREGDDNDTSSEIDFDGDIDDDEDEEEDEGFQDDRSANFTFNLN